MSVTSQIEDAITSFMWKYNVPPSEIHTSSSVYNKLAAENSLQIKGMWVNLNLELETNRIELKRRRPAQAPALRLNNIQAYFTTTETVYYGGANLTVNNAGLAPQATQEPLAPEPPEPLDTLF